MFLVKPTFSTSPEKMAREDAQRRCSEKMAKEDADKYLTLTYALIRRNDALFYSVVTP